jgi:hypothetical protein
MNRTLRLLVLVAALAVAVAILEPVVQAGTESDGRLLTSDGDTVEITERAAAAGLTFAPGVAPGDRAWIAAALARARPEAAALIAQVDGLVMVGTFADDGPALGITRGHERGFAVDLNVGPLNGERAGDRATVVLHELGHVIDFALVPAAMNTALDGLIPHGRACGLAVDCDLMEERFADTFAKWALHGAVSQAGAGYGIPMPASIEDWGAPLARLSLDS